MKTFHFKILKVIVKQAVPSIVQQSMPSISTSFVTFVVAGFWVAAIAGFGVAGKIETLLLLLPRAFNILLSYYCSYSFSIYFFKGRKIKENTYMEFGCKPK